MLANGTEWDLSNAGLDECGSKIIIDLQLDFQKFTDFCSRLADAHHHVICLKVFLNSPFFLNVIFWAAVSKVMSELWSSNAEDDHVIWSKLDTPHLHCQWEPLSQKSCCCGWGSTLMYYSLHFPPFTFTLAQQGAVKWMWNDNSLFKYSVRHLWMRISLVINLCWHFITLELIIYLKGDAWNDRLCETT